MGKITNEQLHRAILEIRVVLLGVEKSEDMGLYGEVRDLRKLMKEINGTVKSDHAWISALRWITYILALALIGAIVTGTLGIW